MPPLHQHDSYFLSSFMQLDTCQRVGYCSLQGKKDKCHRRWHDVLKRYFPLHLRSWGMRGSHNMPCNQLKTWEHSAWGQTVAGRKKDVSKVEECSLLLSLCLLPSTLFLRPPRQHGSVLISCPGNLYFSCCTGSIPAAAMEVPLCSQ